MSTRCELATPPLDTANSLLKDVRQQMIIPFDGNDWCAVINSIERANHSLGDQPFRAVTETNKFQWQELITGLHRLLLRPDWRFVGAVEYDPNTLKIVFRHPERQAVTTHWPGADYLLPEATTAIFKDNLWRRHRSIDRDFADFPSWILPEELINSVNGFLKGTNLWATEASIGYFRDNDYIKNGWLLWRYIEPRNLYYSGLVAATLGLTPLSRKIQNLNRDIAQREEELRTEIAEAKEEVATLRTYQVKKPWSLFTATSPLSGDKLQDNS